MGHALELIVDDQLRNELDETKHVDSLGEGRNNERIPSSVRPIFSWEGELEESHVSHFSLFSFSCEIRIIAG